MQEAKDLHFTENYLPQISKKSGMEFAATFILQGQMKKHKCFQAMG